MVRLRCPPAWPGGLGERCAGKSTLSGSREKFAYDIPAGKKKVFRFDLRDSVLGKIEGGRDVVVTARTANRDEAAGTKSKLSFSLGDS